MDKIGIVILNYLNWEDTIECVDSLSNQTSNKFEVCIVDNGSPNESFQKLNEEFVNVSNVHVINSGKNLGFAKGNNVGINYMIDKFNIYNILVVNNDTIFSDESLLRYLYNLKISKNIGAIGPRIIGNDNKEQNPVAIKNGFIQIIKSIIITLIQIIGFEKLVKTNRKIYSSNKNKYNYSDEYILHGAAIFLTENYLKKVYGFYPETFLYFEENILEIIMKKMNLRMVFDENIYISHKEDQSSALSFGNSKKIFNKYALESELVALKIIFYSIEKIIRKINKKDWR